MRVFTIMSAFCEAMSNLYPIIVESAVFCRV